MSSDPKLRSEPATPGRFPETVTLGDGKVTATFVCGFLGCDRRLFNPLVSTLPRQLHLPGLSSGWLQSFARQVVDPASGRLRADAPGRADVRRGAATVHRDPAAGAAGLARGPSRRRDRTRARPPSRRSRARVDARRAGRRRRVLAPDSYGAGKSPDWPSDRAIRLL